MKLFEAKDMFKNILIRRRILVSFKYGLQSAKTIKADCYASFSKWFVNLIGAILCIVLAKGQWKAGADKCTLSLISRGAGRIR